MSDTVNLRPMLDSDIESVCQIEKICFSVPWSKKAFESELTTNPCARYLIAEKDGEVCGYGGMWIILGEAHVTNVAVHPVFRGQGIGRAIMHDLMLWAWKELSVREMTLEVRVGNETAKNLYRSMGFTQQGIRKNYYEDNKEDAAIMWCKDITLNLSCK